MLDQIALALEGLSEEKIRTVVRQEIQIAKAEAAATTVVREIDAILERKESA